MPARHLITAYARCIHTCVPDGCLDRSGNTLWTRNGNPLRRHATNKRLHGDCAPPCRGNHCLGLTGGKYEYSIIATPKEVKQAFGPDHDNNTKGNDPMDVEDGVDDGESMRIDGADDGESMKIDGVVSSTIQATRDSSPSGADKSDDKDAVYSNEESDLIPHQPTERQTEFIYRVVYVPDPTHRKSLEEVPFELCFLDTRIHQNEWDAVKHLKDSVHLISGPSRSKRMVRVYMDEWLCIMIRFMRAMHADTGSKMFTVDFMSWENFRDAMVTKRNDVKAWKIFDEVHCLIGGVDISLSYINDDYGLDERQYKIYRDSINNKLSLMLFVWPPLMHLKIGSKERLMEHLDLIAQTKTYTCRPQWRILEDGDELSSEDVLKRTHSDCGSHVLKPGNPLRNWDYLRRETILGSVWLSQEYIPHLHRLGEWRVLIIGGEIIHTVHTIYDEDEETWSWETARTFYSLRELEQLEQSQGLINVLSICNPTEGNHAIRTEANLEFVDFVHRTYKSLYELEARRLFAKPIIGIMCRLDIGIIVIDGRVNYFVNEVERSHNTSLWSKTPDGSGSMSAIGRIGCTMANVFHAWLFDMTRTTLLSK